MAESEEQPILEEGDLVFLYRPKVEEDHPEGLGDLQRMEMVMRPLGDHPMRLCIIGRKRLPDVDDHERNWGFVDMVSNDAKEIEKALRETSYETKTRGDRRQPAARAAGEGVYAITCKGSQMHLSFALELPESLGEVQKALNIPREASYALTVKNPERGEPLAAGLSEGRKADYPKTRQEKFRDRKWAREDNALLDYEGAEFLLVGARPDPERSYGIDLKAEDETEKSADALCRLKLRKSREPIKPMFEGVWD
jgi:hypothetical protein